MIYAKTLDPQWFDYRCYVDELTEEIIIDGGREFVSINDEPINAIKKMLEDYQCYNTKLYYDNFKAYLEDMLPKKKNNKSFSTKELHEIKTILDSEEKYRYYSDFEEELIITCLSILKCVKYNIFALRGCMQRECVEMYAPTNTTRETIDYIEAVYFGTGTEIEIHDEDNEVEGPADIRGYCFYTASYDVEKLKEEIAKTAECKKEDVVLYILDGYTRIPKYQKA